MHKRTLMNSLGASETRVIVNPAVAAEARKALIDLTSNHGAVATLHQEATGILGR
jgi:hypothetical protein